MKKLLLAGLCLAGLMLRAGVEVKTGEKIAFLGDSITYYGAASPSGYCNLVLSGLAANGVKAEPVFAGISGNKSNQMLERLEADVLSKSPQWLLLSCGVNDVWHGEKGVPLPDYEKNITAIVDKARAAGVRVVILTSTMIGEDSENDNNRKLEEYNAFLRKLAEQKQCLIADLSEEMKTKVAAEVAAGRTAGTLLTVDGVHMNPLGNIMMAKVILKTLGLDASQLAIAEQVWQAVPAACDVRGAADITIAEYKVLDAAAKQRGVPVQEFLNQLLAKSVKELKQP
ncbi:MAG: SGNH/GDSL hydrolase family protein [Victivallaceae bacterium]